MKVSIIIFVILITGFISVRGQDTVRSVYTGNKIDSIYSTILQQERLIQVFTPQSYKPGSNTQYDVLYVLDGGNWNTGLINNVQRFQEGEGKVPPTIVVSVLGIDRNKDLTPTHLADWPTSGGGNNFLHFLKDELIPYINKNYPSNGDNTLWGHSLGGLFVINALLTEPGAFKSYIAVDPSLWWDHGYIPKIAREKLPALAGTNNTLFVSGRLGREAEAMKVTDMDTILHTLAPAGLKWEVIQYPDETHSSIRLKSTYDGLKFTFGWNKSAIEFHPMNGMVVNGQPIKVWSFGDTANLRYTLDGTEPGTASPGVNGEIGIDNAARLTIKQFTNRARYDKMKSGVFTTGTPLKAATKGKSETHYLYYEEDPKKPKQEGIVKDKLTLPRKNDFRLVVDGWMEAKEAGYYVFVFNADTDSKFYLNNQELIHWKGSYDEFTYTYIVPLEKGYYPYKITYLHKNADFGLKLSYLPPAGIKMINPVSLPFYSSAVLEKLVTLFKL
ncbi:alpha/beta hydrolase-fold protein [Chitinophaga sp.]|uniref:alpha/beta hydrolase-fold protein n=1 Tax=Chitinophaga sp. TaxID=1869181 RepID=UPI0031D56351